MTTIRETNISDNLDLTGKTLLLPLETDSVLHFANRASFPAVGRLKRIYVAEDTAAHWHWTGTTYQISAPTTDEFATLEGTVAAAEEDIAALQATVATATGDLAALQSLSDTLRGFEQVPTFADLPPTGRLTRLYLVQESNQTFRWTGTQYRLTPDEADAGTY